MNKRIDSLAIASCILGIASLFLGPFGFIPAIIFGHISRSRIKSNERISGRTLATVGMIFGYVFLGLTVLMLLLFIFFGVS